jgi:hypothetical protein
MCAQLARRQVEGKSVSVALMNLVLRGLALQGAVEQCGRLFEEYKVDVFVACGYIVDVELNA